MIRKIVKSIVFSLAVVLIVITTLVFSSSTEATVATVGLREMRFEAVALLESYQAGENITSVTIDGMDIRATFEGTTTTLSIVYVVVDGVTQLETVEAVLTQSNKGRVSIEWDYGTYKREISLRKGELQDKFTLNDTSGLDVDVIYNGKGYKLKDELEVPHNIVLPDSEHLVWMKDVILWTESEGYKWVSFYYDKRLIPDGLTDEELLVYWDELRYIGMEQFAEIIGGNKDYSAFSETYVGSPKLKSKVVEVETFDEETGEFVTEEVIEWDYENYMVMGVYNSNLGGIERD